MLINGSLLKVLLTWEMVKKIRELQIDILVDLAGHTKGNRLGVFAYKPTPISCSWWIGSGYTTGLSAIDYFLTDDVMAPPGSEHLFSETIMSVTVTCNCNMAARSAKMGSVNRLPALRKRLYNFWHPYKSHKNK